ncbi:serine/threonine-protein kinase VRK1-like [Actinia tenebrosa]|uniref:non-specific serine/threonine protein kinase n=1 Tax=Actinia tenebrosa TaxID=6105 RepID=A0A6P8HT96_ACTTE|nr:serine/threonine-protein kinase VRK1-like [Actinia tenebrosa]
MSSRGKRKATSQAKSKGEADSKRPKSAASMKPRRPKGMVEVPSGTVLTDLTKKQWKLGKLIGWGGFGALYLASPDCGKPVSEDAENVIKICKRRELQGTTASNYCFQLRSLMQMAHSSLNLHFIRVAKPDNISSWMKTKKLKHLGVPLYLGSGSVEHDNAKMRFLVMERYDKDVDQIFQQHNRRFDIRTVLMLGLRILDILEYIHENEYAHADIKGSNLMMGYSKGKKDQVYLLDYGLTFRFNPNGEHKEYKEDPKRKHDGTVEFASIDAHKGVAPSRRSDLEILGYVMLQWLCGRLPWEDKLCDKEYVKNQKIRYMDNIPQLIKECLPSGESSEVQQFLGYVKNLEYDQIPDYGKIRQIFQNGLKKRKASDDGRSVIFTPSAGATANGAHEMKDDSKRKTATKKQKVVKASDISDNEEPIPAKKPRSRASPKSTKKSKDIETILSSSDEEERAALAKRRSPKKTKAKSSPRSPRKVTSAPAVVTQAKSTKGDKPVRKPRGRPKKTPAYVDMATSPIVFKD